MGNLVSENSAVRFPFVSDATHWTRPRPGLGSEASFLAERQCEICSPLWADPINSLEALVYPPSSDTSACGLAVDNSLARGRYS
jgi:hypothetical protein